MQRTIRAFLIATTLFSPVTTWAQSPDEAGAKKIEEAVKTYGLDALSKAGALRVTPDGDGYRLAFDMVKLISDAVAPMATQEATPRTIKIIEQPDGKWSFDSSGPFDLTTQYLAADRSASLVLSTKKSTITGVFDPAIVFPRSADLTFADVTLSLKDSRDGLKIGIKDATLSSAVKDLADGHDDVVGTLSLSNIDATHGAFPQPEVKLSAERIEGTYKLGKVSLDGLAAFRHFWRVTARNRSVAVLTDAQRAEAKALFAKYSPFVDMVGTKLSAFKLAAAQGGKGFRLDRLEYDARWIGLAERGELITSTHLINLTIDPGIWPKGLEAILPQEAVLNINFSGFDMGALLNNAEGLDSRRTFSQLSREQSMKRAYPEGTLTMSFADSFVRSSFYEFTLSGQMKGAVDRDQPPKGTLVVTAKNFDQTLKYLQDNTKIVPIYGRFAMIAAVAKGLSKPGPDGTIVWEITPDETGRPSVNGRPLPGR